LPFLLLKMVIKNTKSQDRRVFSRIPANISLRFRNRVSNEWGLAKTEDISARGIGIITEKSLLKSALLEIWLPIIKKGEKFYTRGKVAWAEEAPGHLYRAGILLEKVDLFGMSEVLSAV